jgi:hypothetical protein
MKKTDFSLAHYQKRAAADFLEPYPPGSDQSFVPAVYCLVHLSLTCFRNVTSVRRRVKPLNFCIPRKPRPHGEKKQRIQFFCPIPDVLCFLQDLLDDEKAFFFIVKVYLAAISP